MERRFTAAAHVPCARGHVQNAKLPAACQPENAPGRTDAAVLQVEPQVMRPPSLPPPLKLTVGDALDEH
jgi:hypothetical protein